MDKLEKIFELQSLLDEKLISERDLSEIKFEEWMQKECLAIISELSELLDEVNFKWWKNKKDVNMDNVREELVDIFHFFVSMCIKAKMTPQTLFDGYISKNSENFARQDGLSLKEGYSTKISD